MKNVQVKPSPRWMQERLIAVGLRPINNIVDITNFVLYELGQPMHAFDRRQISGDLIRIRMAQENEAFTTLDERDHRLCHEDIVIADATRPVALGGVMGGLNSEIVDDTTQLVFESATFEATTIRRTAHRHDCRTDSAMRFEKSQDPENADTGIFRALELLLETCPDAVVASELLDSYPGRAEPTRITITHDFIQRRLGIDIDPDAITRILAGLRFGVSFADGTFAIDVPSFRATKDIGVPYDIVEEIGRIYGYDNITPVAPAIALRPPGERNEFRSFEWYTRDLFALELGFTEVMNYSFVGADLIRRSGGEPGKELMLRNALASHHDRMRRSLAPGLLEQITGNLRYFHDFSLFEVGRVYLKEDRHSPDLAEEHTMLAAAMINAGKEDFYHLKGAVERYLQRLGLNGVSFEPGGKRSSRLGAPRSDGSGHGAAQTRGRAGGTASPGGAEFRYRPAPGGAVRTGYGRPVRPAQAPGEIQTVVRAAQQPLRTVGAGGPPGVRAGYRSGHPQGRRQAPDGYRAVFGV